MTGMNYEEYVEISSEIPTLERILRDLPDYRDVERMGVEVRLRRARAKLEGVRVPPGPNTIHISFQGEPVVDGAGIDTNFAGKTTTAFSESTAITIASSTGELKDIGAIPHRGLSQPILFGITRGAFGFQVKLPTATIIDRADGQTVNPAVRAVQMIQDLVQASIEGDDENLAELVAQMHPRAVRKVAEFLSILKNNQAQVVIGLNGREVALRNADEVERATRRLAPRNIQETTNLIAGVLIGMVPARRFFEFQIPGSDDNIEGRIGLEVQDPYRMAALYTNTQVRASIRRAQIGRGQPKYTLLDIL